MKDASPGFDLVLTIDKGLQQKIVDVLEQELKQNDTATRGVRGSYKPENRRGFGVNPVFLPMTTIFFNRIVARSISEPNSRSSQAVFNRVISGQYSSGSSIKPFLRQQHLKRN